ncbi:Thioredoxin-like fold domain-containing protein [Strongyloides ratti]|uniref:Thioredoxin-like fold domain-containing protein n=1 Tax=Strongyloides ratti TaxID=34506 RepID=A0A090LA80_STRRB|nr:Thioredoxin-like fold domain-containing protein [Strongyloides ratti]CEF65048.1 Thioredoxin-like fold domain-containing protein [Strongyloides ratti]
MNFNWNFFIVIFFVILTNINGECPMKRKVDNGKSPGTVDNKPPSIMPPDHYIQTTFIYRDLTEDEKKFSTNVINVINALRFPLKEQGKLTIDNENINCNEKGFIKCEEFPKESSFHFLIVEDSSRGAAIYTIPSILNREIGQIEAALLDAFSRHSLFSLMGFTSLQENSEIGFISEIPVNELKEMVENNKKEEKKRKKMEEIIKKRKAVKVFTRGVFELDLIDEKILELKSIESPTSFGKLENWKEDMLNNAIEENDIVFVMFWSNTSSISTHSIKLWAKASDKVNDIILADTRKIKIGYVACHNEMELCEIYGIGKKNQHYLFMYENGKISLNMPNIKDENYYIEWIQMILDNPSIELENEEDIENVMNGNMVGFNGKRKAITLGIFNDIESNDFKNFEKVSLLFRGKYHFVYYFNDDTDSTITVIRPFENGKNQMRLYDGDFTIESIMEFVSYASLPTVIDLTNGFTNDAILKRNKVIVMIHNNNQDIKQEYINKVTEYVNWKTGKSVIFTYIDYKKDNDIHKILLQKFHLTDDELPYIFMYENNHFSIKKCTQKSFDIKKIVEMNEKDYDRRLAFPTHIVNPLRYLNLAKTNVIFGEQNILLLAGSVYEPEDDDDIEEDPHVFEKLDLSKMGGCPMAHIASRLREKEIEEENEEEDEINYEIKKDEL